jgi:DNA mismatch endonuclease (patch repair protein)
MHAAELPGQPDFVFPEERLAVFVDGDFWHGRQWSNRGLRSLADQFRRARNRRYWIAKIARNVSRDRRVRGQLNRRGWHVVRIWESDLREAPAKCLERIRRKLEKAP